MNKWDVRFLDLASLVASWSKDPSSKVGCVISNSNHIILSVGFNGMPRGVDDDKLLEVRSVKLEAVIHAEENALLFARGGVAGATAYVTHHPCTSCSSKLIQAGIARIMYLGNADFEARWAENLCIATLLLTQAGVVVEVCRKD